MRNIIIGVMVVSILGLGAFMALNFTYYRGGGLAAEVQAMRDKEEAAKKQREEARAQAQRDRQAAAARNNQRNAQRPANRNQPAGGRYEINPDQLFKDIALNESQKSKAADIAARHRDTIAGFRRQQRDAQELSRLGMLSDVLKANGGKIPDPEWNNLAPAELHKAVQEHADVSAEAKAAAEKALASWQDLNQTFTGQMRAARESATTRLLALLSPDQRRQYDAAHPRTAEAK